MNELNGFGQKVFRFDHVWASLNLIQVATPESEVFVWTIAAAIISSQSSGAPPAVTSITIRDIPITSAPNIHAWNIDKSNS